jgi:hypothetical protein
MFRIIKRSPWIALGAAGAWFLDPDQGSQRRTMVITKARQWTDELTSLRPATTPNGGPLEATPGTRLGGEFAEPTLAQRSA